MSSGQTTDTQVDPTKIRLESKTTVLGQTLLIDFHPGKDLDTRYQGCMVLAIQTQPFFQYAVDSIANPSDIFQRLDINVGRPKLDRILQNLLDDLNNLRFLDYLRHRLCRNHSGFLFLLSTFLQYFSYFSNQALGIVLIDQR